MRLSREHISFVLGLLLFALALTCAKAQPAPAASGSVRTSALPASAAAPSPLLVRVEQAGPIKLEQGSPKAWWESLLAPVISALTALAGAFIGGSIAQRSSAATINQKANEAEVKDIRTKLDTFYGPFVQRLEEGRLLANELRDRQPDKGKFRTLIKLLDPDWLKHTSPADRTIVTEIVQNGQSLIGLIRDKAGAVDPALSSYLARAATHFTVLKLAKDGALENDPARFERYVFPKQLDDVLELEVKRLTKRANELQSKPTKAHGPMASLVIPKSLALPDWPSPVRQ
jgi:hypothetical protein